MQKIKSAAQLTISDWRYLAKALVMVLAARIRLSRVAPEIILRELQCRSLTLPHDLISRSMKIDVNRVSWAITLAARYVPWRSDCLIQAVAADRWLRKHGLCADFYLGVAKHERDSLEAHAWLRHENITVTGGRYDDYVPLIEPHAE